mmetsp:Transcript_9080/g.22382  ORF Transcript_9080/g.22382 Transcript_9080/m.22382 type:complete len:226 (+) Transcript_9080:824-1501(+)
MRGAFQQPLRRAKRGDRRSSPHPSWLPRGHPQRPRRSPAPATAPTAVAPTCQRPPPLRLCSPPPPPSLPQQLLAHQSRPPPWLHGARASPPTPPPPPLGPVSALAVAAAREVGPHLEGTHARAQRTAAHGGVRERPATPQPPLLRLLPRQSPQRSTQAPPPRGHPQAHAVPADRLRRWRRGGPVQRSPPGRGPSPPSRQMQPQRQGARGQLRAQVLLLPPVLLGR